jgi:hypothetical protein
VLGYAQKAEAMKADAARSADKPELDLLDVVALKDNVKDFVSIANDLLSMLYTGMVSNEEAIDRLLPTKDYLWEKNITLREQLKKATEILGNPSKYKINQILENLPQTFHTYEGPDADIYSERKEFCQSPAEAATKNY